MTTYVQRAVTEVLPEPEAETGIDSGDMRWEAEDNMCRQQRYYEELKLRTRAEGFDD